jgi:hypothetical protein
MAGFHRRYHETRLELLNEEQTIQLTKWLLTYKMSYDQIVQKLNETYGIKTTRPALGKFFKKNVVAHLIRLRERAVATAAGYMDEADRFPGKFSKATMDALEVKAMSACFDPSTNPKELKIFLDLLLRWQEQKIREESIQLKLRRLEILERKNEKLEAVFNSRLTSEEVAERCRLIFKYNGTSLPKSTNGTADTETEKNRFNGNLTSGTPTALPE